MRKIYLIRHGQTTSDIEDRHGGSYDDHLTELGREQVQTTATQLVDVGIEKIFSSSLVRAKESAEIIRAKINVDVEIVTELQERDYGILGGLTKAEAREKHPDVVEAHKNPLNTDPEGESYSDFENRVVNTFKKLSEKDFDTIAIVSHGGPIKRILDYLNEPIPDSIDDGGIIEVDIVK